MLIFVLIFSNFVHVVRVFKSLEFKNCSVGILKDVSIFKNCSHIKEMFMISKFIQIS